MDVVATCHTVLLGSMRGQSERSFRFSLQSLETLAPKGLMSVGLVGRPWISIYVRSAPALGEQGILVHQAQIPVDPAGFFEATTIRGRTFVDVNQSGAWEEGEPLVGGVDVIADGMRVGRSTGAGTFTIQVHQTPIALWGRTTVGSGVPVRLGRHIDLRSLWIVDLPVPATAAFPAHEPRTGGLTELFLEAGASGGAGGGLAGGGAKLHHGTERTAVNLSADFGRREVLTLSGVRIETSTTYEADAVYHSDAASVNASWRRGLMDGVRWGGLRPTKPAAQAWRIAAQAVPTLVNVPLGGEAVVDSAFELAGAEGDLWSCTLANATSEWSFDDVWFNAAWQWGEHSRLERKGARTESYGQTSLAMRGMVDLDGHAWPYRLDVAWGKERTLAPACGLTPKEGIHGSLQLSQPSGISQRGDAAGILEGVRGSASTWPSSDSRETVGLLGWRSSERAFEILAESINIARHVGWDGTLKVNPFLQWGIVPKEEDRVWSAAGMRGEAGIASHRITLEVGPKAISDRKPSADPPSVRAGRLAGSWRYERGPLRPHIAFERDGGAGTNFDFEAGFSLSAALTPARAPWIGREVRFSLSVDRALSESDREDEVALVLTRGGRTEPTDRLAIEWKESVDASGLGFFDIVQSPDESKVSVVFSRTRPGTLVSREAHEARPVFYPEGWSARLEFSKDGDAIEYSRALGAEGVWRLGTWLIELRRLEGVENGAPFESSRGRLAWDMRFGRWSLEMELVSMWSELTAHGKSASGYIVRGTRHVSDAMDAFVQVGRSPRPQVELGAAAWPSPNEGHELTGETASIGVTLDLSKLGTGPFIRVPVLLTAGVEGALPQSHQIRPDAKADGRSSVRYFIGVGIPIGLGGWK